MLLNRLKGVREQMILAMNEMDEAYIKEALRIVLAEQPNLKLPEDVIEQVWFCADISEGGDVWFSVLDRQVGFEPGNVLETIARDFKGGDLRDWLPKHLLEIHLRGDCV